MNEKEKKEKLQIAKNDCSKKLKEEVPEEFQGKVSYFAEESVNEDRFDKEKATVVFVLHIAPKGVVLHDKEIAGGCHRVLTFPAFRNEAGEFKILSVEGFDIKPDEIEGLNKGIEKLRKNPEWSIFMFDYVTPLQGGDFGLLSITRNFEIQL
jgi:hypothetical protein